MTKREMIEALLKEKSDLDTEFIILDNQDDPCAFTFRVGSLTDALYMDIDKK